MENNIITINTDGYKGVQAEGGLLANRLAVAKQLGQAHTAPVTISIQAYNRLDKTKRCVESVLHYTKNIDYELLLIDNGSTDDTLNYFKGIDHEKKTIVHITHNIGSEYPWLNLGVKDVSDYWCHISNDVIVTKNWLNNLLICLKSDPKIGVAVPAMNNVSNYQQVDLNYGSSTEMQAEAAKYNVSDPKKWEERLRLIPPLWIFNKGLILAKGIPISDCGFFHDFADDDFSFMARRLGYKTIYAPDTWVCHDHDFRNLENKDAEEFNKSLAIGRQNFKDKYFGIDAWDDVNNYYIGQLEGLPQPAENAAPKILGVDVRCGTPILDIKNRLRKYGIFDAELSAFTADAKYWLDLKTVCGGPVECAPPEYLPRAFQSESFDYTICDKPINTYGEPMKLLDDLFGLTKPRGIVLLNLKNAYSFLEYLNILGNREFFSESAIYNLSMEAVVSQIKRYGNVLGLNGFRHQLPESQLRVLENLLPPNMPVAEKNEILGRLVTDKFLITAQKRG